MAALEVIPASTAKSESDKNAEYFTDLHFKEMKKRISEEIEKTTKAGNYSFDYIMTDMEYSYASKPIIKYLHDLGYSTYTTQKAITVSWF